MDVSLRHALERIFAPFIDEHVAGGGIDVLRSRWQVAGRGAGVGMDVLPGRADVRYLPFLIDGLQWFAEVTQQPCYRRISEEQARFIALGVNERSPTWVLGNALECIGMDHAARPGDGSLARRPCASSSGRGSASSKSARSMA